MGKGFVRNERPRNLGGVYRQAIEAARFDYLVMIPGDNENRLPALIAPLEAIMGRSALESIA